MTNTDQHEPPNDLFDDLCKAEDQYQDVARALGCKTFFHADVMARARACKAAYDGVREGVR